MNTPQDNPTSKKRIFWCYLLWMTAHLLTAMPTHWFLLVIGSDEIRFAYCSTQKW